MRIAIRGGGVAACACAHLLRTAGLEITVDRTARNPVPAILIGDATQSLIHDIFGREDIFRDLPRIDRRIVCWGVDAEPVTLPHSAVVVSENDLCGRLWEDIEPGSLDAAPPDWTVLAAAPSNERRFGSRIATALPVTLKSPGARACWIESLEDGWLFLLPDWLLCVGGSPESMLSRSRLVGDQVRLRRGPGATFPASPRVSDPLCGPGWLACGTAAIGFDPLCGDGTGQAVREAILAAAVIRASANGEPQAQLLEHYRNRLLAAFRKHLQVSGQFYSTGHSGPWWTRELEALRSGIEWSTRELTEAGNFRYRLSGFDLIRAADTLA